jgi:NitT/TauT family transport system permease protein
MKDFINRHKKPLSGFAAALFWVAAWQLAAVVINRRLVLASPLSVASRLLELLGLPALFELLGMPWFRDLAAGGGREYPGFYAAVLNSFWHITLGFLLALAAGLLLAAAASRLAALKRLLRPLITAMNSTPVASFTILALMLAGSRHISTLMSFIMVTPIIYSNLTAGIAGIGRASLEAADVFGMPRSERLRYIYVPEVLPHFSSACVSGIAISWKSGVAAEVIGITANTVGGRLYDAKILLASDEVFAFTLVIVLVSLACERLASLALKRAAAALLD